MGILKDLVNNSINLQRDSKGFNEELDWYSAKIWWQFDKYFNWFVKIVDDLQSISKGLGKEFNAFPKGSERIW